MRHSPRLLAVLLLLGACHEHKFPSSPHVHYDYDSGPWPAADSGVTDAGTATEDAGPEDAGLDGGTADAGTDAGSDAGSPDAGGPPACKDTPDFVCGAYAFTYTELHGIDVSLGQGYQQLPNFQVSLASLRDRDCVRGSSGINPPSYVTAGQAPDDSYDLLAHVKFTPDADPDPTAEAFAQYCRDDEPLTHHFYRYAEFGGPSTIFDKDDRVAGEGKDCGDRYVFAVSEKQVTAVAVTFRFPSAEAMAWVEKVGADKAVLTFASSEQQAATDLALAQVGAQVELHVASSGLSHDKLRGWLAQSSCRGDHLSGCRDLIAQIMTEGEQMARRAEYDLSSFAVTNVPLP